MAEDFTKGVYFLSDLLAQDPRAIITSYSLVFVVATPGMLLLPLVLLLLNVSLDQVSAVVSVSSGEF